MRTIYNSFIVLFVLLLTLSMVGCASSGTTEKQTEGTTLPQATERQKISENEAIRIARNSVEEKLNSRLSRFGERVALLTIGSAKMVGTVAGYYEIEVKGNYYPVDEYGTYGYQRTFDESILVGMYDGKVSKY